MLVGVIVALRAIEAASHENADLLAHGGLYARLYHEQFLSSAGAAVRAATAEMATAAAGSGT